ncbi:LMO4.2 family protein [Megaselia abdita]
MNAHYSHHYPDLPSSHSPSPENSGNCYTNLTSSSSTSSPSNGSVAIGVVASSTANGSFNDTNNSNHNNNNSTNNNTSNSGNSNNGSNNDSMTMVHQNQNGNGQPMALDTNSFHHHQQQQTHHPHHHNNHHLNNNNNTLCNAIKYCAGCGGKIMERYLLYALDRYWHNSCLKCYCCGATLGDIGSSCYTKAGMILCKPDYVRMFATSQCSACGQTIAPNEFVMRTTSSNQQQTTPAENNNKPFSFETNHVFHLKCFTCSKCATQLRPGDRYYMLGGSLVCEPDWMKLLKNVTANTSSSGATTPIRKGKVGRPRRSRD